MDSDMGIHETKEVVWIIMTFVTRDDLEKLRSRRTDRQTERVSVQTKRRSKQRGNRVTSSHQRSAARECGKSP